MDSTMFYKVMLDGKPSMFLVNDGLAINKANGTKVRFDKLFSAVVDLKKVGVNIDIKRTNYEEYENF